MDGPVSSDRTRLQGIGVETTDWERADGPDLSARIVQLFVHGIDD